MKKKRGRKKQNFSKLYKKDLRDIKAVVFDIGGVLAVEKSVFSVHEEMAKKFNLDMDSWFDSIDSVYADSIEGQISEKDTLARMSRNLKTTPKKLERLFIKTYKKHFKQNKKLYKFAFKLKKQNYKIGILSDQWHVSKKALVPKKYTKEFNAVVASCDVGVRKPNKKIYKLIIKKLKLKPKHILFIDNREWNLIPAQKQGMKVLLYKNNKDLFKKLNNLI